MIKRHLISGDLHKYQGILAKKNFLTVKLSSHINSQKHTLQTLQGIATCLYLKLFRLFLLASACHAGYLNKSQPSKLPPHRDPQITGKFLQVLFDCRQVSSFIENLLLNKCEVILYDTILSYLVKNSIQRNMNRRGEKRVGALREKSPSFAKITREMNR